MSELLYSGYNNIVLSLNRNNVNIQNFKINLFKKIATSYICFEMTQICLCTRGLLSRFLIIAFSLWKEWVPFKVAGRRMDKAALPDTQPGQVVFNLEGKSKGRVTGLGILHQSAVLWTFRVQSWQRTGDPVRTCSSILIKVLSKKNLKSCKVYLVHDGVKKSLTQKETCSSPGKRF